MAKDNPIWDTHTLRDEAALWALDRLMNGPNDEAWDLTASVADLDRLGARCWEIANAFVAFRDTGDEQVAQVNVDQMIFGPEKQSLSELWEAIPDYRKPEPEPVETWSPNRDYDLHTRLGPRRPGHPDYKPDPEQMRALEESITNTYKKLQEESAPAPEPSKVDVLLARIRELAGNGTIHPYTERELIDGILEVATVPRDTNPKRPGPQGAMNMALALHQQAVNDRFDFEHYPADAINKVIEELFEFRVAKDRDSQLDELGDVLFSAINLCRWAGVDPEIALDHANIKFAKRYNRMQDIAEKNYRVDSLRNISPATLDILWARVKDDD